MLVLVAVTALTIIIPTARTTVDLAAARVVAEVMREAEVEAMEAEVEVEITVLVLARLARTLEVVTMALVLEAETTLTAATARLDPVRDLMLVRDPEAIQKDSSPSTSGTSSAEALVSSFC